MNVKEALEKGIMTLEDEISSIDNTDNNCYNYSIKYYTWVFAGRKQVDGLYEQALEEGASRERTKLLKAFK